MAQQLRWENVAPVSLNDAANMYSAANVGIQQGLSSLAHAAASYKNMNQEEANKQLANNISKYNTSSALSKAYTDGSLYDGVNKDWLDSSHIAGIQGQVLTLAKNERDNALANQKALTEQANANQANLKTNLLGTVAAYGADSPEGRNAMTALFGYAPSTVKQDEFALNKQANAYIGRIVSAGLNPEGIRALMDKEQVAPEVQGLVYQKFGMDKAGQSTPLGDAVSPNIAAGGNFGLNSSALYGGGRHPYSNETFINWANDGAKKAKQTPSNSSAAGVGQITISNLQGRNKDGLWYQAGLKNNDLFNPENQLKVLDYTVNKYKNNPTALRTLWSFLPNDMSSMSVDDIKDAIIRHENGTSLTKLQNYISQNKQTNPPSYRLANDLRDALTTGSPNDAVEAARNRVNILTNAFNSKHNQEFDDPSYIIASGGKKEDQGKDIGELAEKYGLDLRAFHNAYQQLDGKATPAAIAALMTHTKEGTGFWHPLNSARQGLFGTTPLLQRALDRIKSGGGVEGATKRFTPILNQRDYINNLSDRLNKVYEHFLGLTNKDNSPQNQASMAQDRANLSNLVDVLDKATS